MASACARFSASRQRSSFSLRSSRFGLTLIELLVTIVIMVTVLAGVLPLVSPNNNSRKLREASRQLNSLLSQAQNQAARDGRPVGVAFREFGAAGSLSGMTLEAFTIAEPPPFAGFSEHSRVSILEPPDSGLTYGDQSDPNNANGNQGKLFDPLYRGYKIWQLYFTLYDADDLIPPRMIRNGDVLNVEGNHFLVVDDPGGSEGAHAVDKDTGYVTPTSRLFAIWLDARGRTAIPGKKQYSFRRQPVSTSDQPLQFPRGIGIDLEGSGADGLNVPSSLDNVGPTTVSVMFSPNGSLKTLYQNDNRMDGVEQVYLLLGLVENGNGNALNRDDYDFVGNPAADAADVASRRSRVNWLNPDSRWVSVNRTGRIITTDNFVSFDPSDSAFHDNGTISEQHDKQIAVARQYARQMAAAASR